MRLRLKPGRLPERRLCLQSACWSAGHVNPSWIQINAVSLLLVTTTKHQPPDPSQRFYFDGTSQQNEL